jgi:transcriptional regulator with XRE-family HTH domain
MGDRGGSNASSRSGQRACPIWDMTFASSNRILVRTVPNRSVTGSGGFSMFTATHYRERARVAIRLRLIRVQMGLTQTDLASRLGFAHPCSVSSIEKARRPLYETEVEAFAKALACSVEDILGPEDSRSAHYPVAKRNRAMTIVATLVLSSAIVGSASAENGAERDFRAPGADAEPNGSLSVEQGSRDPDRPRGRLLPLIESDNCDPGGSAPDGHIGS